MKVILTHEVTGLGAAGDVIDVKDGYARNFLFRRSLATAWTKGGQKQVDAIAKGREVRAVKSLEEAQSIKGNLESKAITVAAHAGKEGRLFGAVSTADIAAAVQPALLDCPMRKLAALDVVSRTRISAGKERRKDVIRLKRKYRLEWKWKVVICGRTRNIIQICSLHGIRGDIL